MTGNFSVREKIQLSGERTYIDVANRMLELKLTRRIDSRMTDLCQVTDSAGSVKDCQGHVVDDPEAG